MKLLFNATRYDSNDLKNFLDRLNETRPQEAANQSEQMLIFLEHNASSSRIIRSHSEQNPHAGGMTFAFKFVPDYVNVDHVRFGIVGLASPEYWVNPLQQLITLDPTATICFPAEGVELLAQSLTRTWKNHTVPKDITRLPIRVSVNKPRQTDHAVRIINHAQKLQQYKLWWKLLGPDVIKSLETFLAKEENEVVECLPQELQPVFAYLESKEEGITLEQFRYEYKAYLDRNTGVFK